MSFASLDRDSSSSRTWRTSSMSLLTPQDERGETFRGIWPRSAMSCHGTVFPLPPLARRTSVTGSSALLPTPVAKRTPATGAGAMEAGHGIMLQQAVEDLLPTPVAALGESGSAATRSGYRREPTTAGAIESLLPTPSATEYGSNQSPSEGAAVRPSLPGLVELLPTPLAEQKGPASKRGANAQGGGLSQRDSAASSDPSHVRRSRGPSDDRDQPARLAPDAERSGVRVEWGKFAPAVERWEALHGRAPEPLCFFRGVDARAAAGLERSRLSALGDGVQMQAGWFLGAGLMTLAAEMGL